MTDNFAGHPPSIGEIRADKSYHSKDWTPRDALISVLRDIDEGKIKPEALIVCMRLPGSSPNTVKTQFTAAVSDYHVALGLLTAVIHRMQEPDPS